MLIDHIYFYIIFSILTAMHNYFKHVLLYHDFLDIDFVKQELD